MKIVECPRDAMQGITGFIDTSKKIEYLNSLLKVGFDTLDFGSFVSPKAIPQLKDTTEVLAGLDLENTKTKLLAIIANTRGAEEAVKHKEIQYLGFPFSISETFQLRNTNSTIHQSLQTVAQIQNLCIQHNKQLVVYVSMGFGNPYGDVWNEEIVVQWSEKLAELGIGILALSDTVGVANPESIERIYKSIIPALPKVEFGAHLHTTPDTWFEKIEAAYTSGCRRFDTAIKGFGGCPMAKDELVGNMPTENVLTYLESRNIELGINKQNFDAAMQKALLTFPLVQTH